MPAPVVEAVRARGPAPSDLRREHCPLCSGSQLSPCLPLPHNPLLRCRDCGLYSTERLGSEEAVAEYYRCRTAHEGKLEDGDNNATAIAALQAELLSSWIGPSPGKLLEVGCSSGHLLSEMEARGWECSGVDLSEPSLEAARSRTRATLHLGTLVDFNEPQASFDAIAAFDLLAHLTDPLSTLNQMASLLRPGGWLVLSTVNEGWPLVPVFRRLFTLLPEQTAGIRDEMYEAQHYCYFDETTVSRLICAVGLEPAGAAPLAPFSARHFRHQYPLAKRLALSGMLGVDRLLGASRKMLVAARKPRG